MLNALTLVVALAASPNASAPGGQLRPGMQLVYAAQGKPSPPWIIDSVELGVPFDGRRNTTCVRLRTGAPEPETRRLHRRGGMLYQHGAAGWTASRPVWPDRVLVVRDAQGRATSRYETGPLAEETIGGVTVPVVHTTVVFFGPDGTPVKRLRERYAPGLATATGGVFEKRDPTAPGGFAPTMSFELVEIRSR